MDLKTIAGKISAYEPFLVINQNDRRITATLCGHDDTRLELTPDGDRLTGTLIGHNRHAPGGWEILEAKWDPYDPATDNLRRYARTIRVELMDRASDPSR